jgi:NAD(P)-dependent dehydrogenase (short-subunit alcohol dehydrogenase family)
MNGGFDLSGQVVAVTGASSGIGEATALACARAGAAVALAARRADRIEALAQRIAGEGGRAIAVTADVGEEGEAGAFIERAHAELGRLDVLVNNAGVGIGAAAADHQTKFVDMQLDVNLRAIVLFYRECADMLRAAGSEHSNALVVNMASLAGKSPQPWLSVYAATKAAVVAYTSAMNKELNSEGIKSVAFCPGFVDTDMTEFIRGTVPPEEMLQTSDITAALRFLLHVSPACVVPEIIFQRPGEAI